MPKKARMPTAVKKALGGSGVKIPQMAELVSHFLELAGGPKAMAKMLMEEFLRAREGSIMRQRILESVIRMISIAGQQYAPIEETDMISTEDLEKEITTLMNEIPDGSEEESEAVPRRDRPAGDSPGGA